MQIELKLDYTEFSKWLSKISDDMKGKTARSAISAGGFTLEKHIKLNIDKQGLRDTGRLINSVSVGDIKANASGYECYVGPRGVIYARIHEFGGTIVPKRAKMLHWVDKTTGKDVFAMRAVIPARPYMRPAIDENKKEIFDAMITQISKELMK